MIAMANTKFYQILSDLIFPQKEKNFTFQLLVDKLLEYFKSPQHQLYKDLEFFQCHQKSQESVHDFGESLKALAQQSNFEDRILLLQFLKGLQDRELRKYLIEPHDVKTFDQALKLALQKDQLQLKRDKNVFRCYFCGKSNHMKRNCKNRKQYLELNKKE